MRKITPKTDKYMIGGIGPSKKGESKPIYPTIRIDLEHIPEAKNWKLGKMYKLELGLKLIGLSQSQYNNSTEFEIHEIESESSKDEDDEKEEK